MSAPKIIIDFFGAMHLVALRAAANDLGMSPKTLTTLCTCLGVPKFHLDNLAYIDPIQLCIALKCATRVGQPDFLAPGSKKKSKSSKNSLDRHHQTTTLDPATLRDNLTSILAELAYSKKLLSFRTHSEAMKYARVAAERLVLAGFSQVPATAQRLMESRALRNHRQKHGTHILDDLSGPIYPIAP